MGWNYTNPLTDFEYFYISATLLTFFIAHAMLLLAISHLPKKLRNHYQINNL
jgi:hypothetical protein